MMAPQQQWEYKVIDHHFDAVAAAVEKTLQDAGAEGWEVISATALPGAYSKYRVLMKRMKAMPPRKVSVH
jgi:hypothetical protein